jgi:5-methylcytosine-specific restriction enzyme A
VATTPILIKPAYAIARRVYSGELTPSEGSRTLNSSHGVNRNSARDLISAYKHLMQGEVFQRGLSAPDMDFYLSRIHSDSGPVALRIALQSLWRHIGYYEGIRRVTLHKLRAIAAKHEADAAAPSPAAALIEDFDEAVKRSMGGSAAARAMRLRTAPTIPKRIPTIGLAFDRNPDVVAEVLLQAKGICARCQKPAPFARKSDGSPYLEVHHKVQLALGGEDSVKNAEALCPNCHRELHHGTLSTRNLD